jgi:2-polyprenyl-3-methyl-5-hydroxy-6-metoxy-1,4-benzoquinol methylase
MIRIEPRKTKKFEEHKLKFNDPSYYSNIYENGTPFTLWSEVRALKGHPASQKLFLDNFVRFYPVKRKLRHELKQKFFIHNSGVHEDIAKKIGLSGSVLDIGSGIGCLKDVFDEMKINVDYYALDICHEFLKLNPAKETNKYCCDFSDIFKILGDKKFDYVIDCNASHYKDYNGYDYKHLLDRLENLALKKYINKTNFSMLRTVIM